MWKAVAPREEHHQLLEGRILLQVDKLDTLLVEIANTFSYAAKNHVHPPAFTHFLIQIPWPMKLIKWPM